MSEDQWKPLYETTGDQLGNQRTANEDKPCQEEETQEEEGGIAGRR